MDLQAGRIVRPLADECEVTGPLRRRSDADAQSLAQHERTGFPCSRAPLATRSGQLKGGEGRLIVKKLLAAVASVALVVTPMAASAQSYGHGHGGEGWGGRGAQQRSYGGGGAYRGYSRGDLHGGYGRDGRRDDHGSNIAGAAIVAGLAGLLLGSALSSQQSSGYSQPYAQPYGGQSYGYPPSYDYQPGW